MTERTPYQQLRQIGYTVRRQVDNEMLDGQGPAARRALDALERSIRRSQDMLKDYEMFELEEDVRKQARLLPKVVQSLVSVRDGLLKASEYQLVGAIDVAQISGELDGLIAKLQ